LTYAKAVKPVYLLCSTYHGRAAFYCEQMLEAPAEEVCSICVFMGEELAVERLIKVSHLRAQETTF
jgi:hypothetical protein